MEISNFRTNLERIRIINHRVYETNLARVFHNLEKAGYEPILIKGWAAAQYYPKPWNRNIGDIDLVFRPEAIDENISDIIYKNTKISFDIHSGFRLLDTVSIEDTFDRCIMKDCLGTPIRVMRAEDHLRVLCVHWMIDGGANKEKLWDIYYIIEKNRKNFEWEQCFSGISSKRRKWIQTVIALAHIYLGLETKDLPFETRIERNRGWVVRAVEQEWKSSVKLLPLENSLKNKNELLRQIFKRIPPNPIQATVEMESEIDGKFRLGNQFLNIYKRMKHSIRKIIGNQK